MWSQKQTISSNIISCVTETYRKTKFTSGIHGNIYQNNFTESAVETKEIWNQNTKYKKGAVEV